MTLLLDGLAGHSGFRVPLRVASVPGWVVLVALALSCSKTVPVEEPEDLDTPLVDIQREIPAPDQFIEVYQPEPFEWRAIDVVWDLIAPECISGQGEFGCPCLEHGDCLSKWCLEHMGGMYCSKDCLEECPEGWYCGAGPVGPDPVFICRSYFPSVCRPCREDGQCTGTAASCISYGEDAGSFCSQKCQTTKDCPTGYSCEDVLTLQLAPIRACVLTAAECPCSPYASALGQDTKCQKSSAYGICHGFRECGEDGLTPCSARMPGPEECDGIDNDCNGATDEGQLCEDQNECTSTWCDGVQGCQVEFLDRACTDDGEPCTLDICQDGVCIHPEGNDGDRCDDGDPCTLDEICQAGQCVWIRLNPLCQAICGDGVCSTLESGDPSSPISCAVDCGPCGDGVCGLHEMGPNGGTCPKDCLSVCGNGKCEGGESVYVCPLDCSGCPDGLCGMNETFALCPADCPPACGNGICEMFEGPVICPVDCKPPCGDGICASGENPTNCPTDCPVCGDGTCGMNETIASCPQDCATACGNGMCEGGESTEGCPVDCGWCGDGVCGYYEKADSCPADCFQGCGDGACGMGETCTSCPMDCGLCCGNGLCETANKENSCTCPMDCGVCGGCCEGVVCRSGTANAWCGVAGGPCINCPATHKSCVDQVCAYLCGDGLCGAGESLCSCPQDCGDPCLNIECGTNSCGASCGTCPAHHICQGGRCFYVPWCGDGTCDGNETCQTCASDCGCSCGETCRSGICTFTACDGRACGADGCGGSCGSCPSHHQCQDGQCVYVPWCGDSTCDAHEDCFGCPTDCGLCCGNGTCEAEFFETCASCLEDCGCPCGHECLAAECVFTACGGKECGGDGCGGSCGSCADHYECLGGRCLYVPWCGDGTCGEGEDCSLCPGDCLCGCGEACLDGTCLFTACDERECGDDGCGGLCGTCDSFFECVEGLCLFAPGCGDGLCQGLETCDSCPADCGLCCGNGACEPAQGENCGTCPADCGLCCGNGACEPAQGESCGTCLGDCPCLCGEACQGGICVFIACAGRECGSDECDGSCGTCDENHWCSDGQCLPLGLLGELCDEGSPCKSGFCVEGVCCNTGCTDFCKSCVVAGSEGTCVFARDNTDPRRNCPACRVCNGAGGCRNAGTGTDPKDDCEESGVDTCGLNGFCNGVGACRYWPVNTVCQPASCSGVRWQPSHRCNGSGGCLAPASQDCSPFACTDAGCLTSCGNPEDCSPGYLCVDQQCVAGHSNGDLCQTGDDCTSGYCVDGVCCNSSCSGPCQQCNLEGHAGDCTSTPALSNPKGQCPVCQLCDGIGLCQPVTAGTDPADHCPSCHVCNGAGSCVPVTDGNDPLGDCSAAASNTCGLDGFCDGGGSCRKWSDATICRAASCSGVFYEPADYCNGEGQCEDSGSVSCEPYACGDDGQCRSSCSVESHCAAGFQCDGQSCQGLKGNGSPCGAGTECSSGVCADAVCCATACPGVCRACNLAGKLGTCSYVTSGQDPYRECPLCQTCNGLGVCQNAAAGTDPKAECDASPSANCGYDGQCKGDGSCRFWGASTVCGQQSCSGSLMEFARFCDSAGGCYEGGTDDCCPYLCNPAGTDCLTQCQTDADCCAGLYCEAPSCVARKANGQVCTHAQQCQSGFCADGRCCNSACNGLCQACHLAGFYGQCRSITAGTDPHGECPICQACSGFGSCVNAASGTDPGDDCAEEPMCGLDGQCNGSGACRFWNTMTACSSAFCEGSVYTPAGRCDGAGECNVGTAEQCEPYVCHGGGCRTSCTEDQHCVAGRFCQLGSCVPLLLAGQVCDESIHCTSGHCVDGICCDSACVGACRSCNEPGNAGSCTFQADGTDPLDDCPRCRVCDGQGSCRAVAAGSDPLLECLEEPAESCGRDGSCDGNGDCRLWPSSTHCAQEFCAASTLHTASYCSGTGLCVAAETSSCCPYLCHPTQASCLKVCEGSGDCCQGFYCDVGQCKTLKVNGQTCALGHECESSFCVDGRCCVADCAGDCRSCNLPGFPGLCRMITAGTDPEGECALCSACNGAGACVPSVAGTDPKNECSAVQPESCGLDGFCDGAGLCRNWNNQVVCIPFRCEDSQYFPDARCDGDGLCRPAQPQECSPYRCTGSGCATHCTGNGECVEEHFCQGGTCQPMLDQGTQCSDAGHCRSGHCEDGVCCDTGCAGNCRSCAWPGTVGVCTLAQPNTDPDSHCSLCSTCNGSGACHFAAEGTDPGDDCPETPESTCGTDGVCNGSGSCRLHGPAVECSGQTCVGHTATPAGYCDGTGDCTVETSYSCCPYSCFGSGCLDFCSLDTHCCTDYYCDSGTCKVRKPLGQPCVEARECNSGWCSDGVCCDGPCSGTCRGCNLPGTAGQCSMFQVGADPLFECPLCQVCDGQGACQAVDVGTDPKEDCASSDPASCGLDGACDGLGTCRYWPHETQCVAPICEGQDLAPADFCDGAGTCVNSGIQPCAPYVCQGDRCRSDCAGDGLCALGYHCEGAVCEGLIPDGGACSSGAQCDSGYCVDDVCCNVSCGGLCEACNRPGFIGQCSLRADGTDPAQECPQCSVCNGAGGCRWASAGTDPKAQCEAAPPATCGRDGQCDGAGACRYWASTTSCETASCSEETYLAASMCNGSGLCDAGEPESCCPFLCGDAACRTTCSLDAHCCPDSFCDGSTCVLRRYLGESCLAASECLSGYCADGRCCDSDCVGTCRSCDLPGTPGWCVEYGDGSDPERECGACQVCDGAGSCGSQQAGTDLFDHCPTDLPSTCQRNGLCDGNGECQLHGPSTLCSEARCTGSALQAAGYCSGLGSCVQGEVSSCCPYTCQDGLANCRTSCDTPSHCCGGYFCSQEGLCLPKIVEGQECASASECLTGFCVDGFCCRTACSGICENCNQAGNEGNCLAVAFESDPEDECGLCQYCSGERTCVPASDGEDPLGQCIMEDPLTCGRDGQCDGLGGCRRWGDSVTCQESVCDAGVRLAEGNCDGLGNCVADDPLHCCPYNCNDQGCVVACQNHGECCSDYYCIEGFCAGKKTDGQGCGDDAQCQSGHCVESVCCNTACDGECRSCRMPGQFGVCVFRATNTDPLGECGLCRVCDGGGLCGAVAEGADPLAHCPSSDPDGCGLNGNCDGFGACDHWPEGTECGAGQCIGTTYDQAPACDGQGTCVPRGQEDCCPFMCGADRCRTHCSSASDCCPDSFCLDGQCLPMRDLGEPCLANGQCYSLRCVDSVCCDTDCLGQCRSCAVPGSEGQCAFLPSGTDLRGNCPSCLVCNGAGGCQLVEAGEDPKEDCSTQPAETCGLTGWCSGSGSCALYDDHTVCALESCDDGLYSADRLCDGIGYCRMAATTFCSPYTCGDSRCRTSCGGDEDCDDGSYCSDPECVVRHNTGLPCERDGQCKTGHCVDGYCCSQSCDGACQRCDTPGWEGQCRAISNGTDPFDECGPCAVCNGESHCSPVPNGSDPKEDCDITMDNPCGLDGSCDGAGACRYFSATTICRAKSCGASIYSPASLCDGAGNCIESTPISCAPFVCNMGTSTCLSSCTMDSHCITGHYCASGSCLPQRPLGTACTIPNQCLSGICVDGNCCNAGCGSLCQACNLPGLAGICTNLADNIDPFGECGLCRVCNGAAACRTVVNGQDPLDQCASTAQTTCWYDGTCNGSGACRFWNSSTLCAVSYCSGDLFYKTRYCTGSGACQTATYTNCCPNDRGYRCTSSGCRTTCSYNSNCCANSWCSDSACINKYGNGAACTSSSQCLSGYCVCVGTECASKKCCPSADPC